MKKLEIDNVCYEFAPDATFEKDGKTYEYISFKKVTTYKAKDGKENKKYQNLTVKPGHWAEFSTWLMDVMSGEPGEEADF